MRAALGQQVRSVPTPVGDVVRTEYEDAIETLRVFPFRSWATHNGFPYPTSAAAFLSGCGSAAEAFFLREFVERPGAVSSAGVAECGGVTVRIQVPCGGYRIDAVVADSRTALAVEIDGLAFHHQSGEQVAADYLRERRLVLRGHTVIRFTAGEAFRSPQECWRQIDAILVTRRAL